MRLQIAGLNHFNGKWAIYYAGSVTSSICLVFQKIHGWIYQYRRHRPCKMYELPTFPASVVIPTLAADSRLLECVESLGRQTRQDFDVIVIDNSGKGLVRRNGVAPGARII